MNRHFSPILQKACFFLGALFLGWTAKAQTKAPTDSTYHQYGMHRWEHRPGPGIHYTPEQRKQMMAINKEYHQKADDLYKQDNLTLKQYKAGLVSLNKEKKDKLAALLTQQQKDELATRRKRMDENHQVMEAAHLERLKLRLNL